MYRRDRIPGPVRNIKCRASDIKTDNGKLKPSARSPRTESKNLIVVALELVAFVLLRDKP